MRRFLALATLVSIALSGAGAYWAAHSEVAMRGVIQVVSEASGGRLRLGKASGSLSGPLAIEQLLWQSPTIRIKINGLQADWQPGALLQGKVNISRLLIDELQVEILGNSESSPPPLDLQLPVTVNVEKVAISSFNLAGLFVANAISARLRSDGEMHQLDDFLATIGKLSLSGSASLGASAPLPLKLNALLSGKLDERPLRLAVAGDGSLERIALAINAEEGIRGHGQATLTLFAAQSFADARLQLEGINLAEWFAGAPRTSLQLQTNLQPVGDALAGDFSLTNQQAGPLDRQLIPLEHLSGQLNGDSTTMQFKQLSAKLSGGASLEGSGEWLESTLNLKLNARRIDALALHTQLRTTQLNGPLEATLSLQQQSLKADLSDSRFSLKVDALHNAGRLKVPALELAAGNSLLKAAGEVVLDSALSFDIEGELRNFDPSRFAKAPGALINSRFKGKGQLDPQPRLAASFQINNSRFAGEPLSGQGDVRLDWPHLQRADISLKAGENHLQANGSFGKAGDALEITIKAPRLAPFGIDGDLDARLQLGGTIKAPQLSASASANRLGRPGSGQLKGVTLKLTAANTASAPLDLDLAIARIDSTEQSGLLRNVHIQASGTNARHTLQGSSQLDGQRKLALRLQGGLEQLKWRGEIQEATLSEGAQTFRLSAPAPLDLAAEGWSLGPARLDGTNQENTWQATIKANADNKHLHAEINGQGTRLGEVSGKLNATMLNAWTINDQAPWQANFKSHSDDLGWLASFLGEQWQSGGRLSGELNITGTPAQPVSSGHFRGEKLMLQIPEQGLHLANGELDIDLSNNLLRVIKLNFDSILQQPPRALQRSEKNDVATLSNRHGRLEISGEIRVDRNKLGERAALDLKLDRFGAYQRPDAWILLSGSGRLSMASDTFGIYGKLAADAGYWQLADASTPKLSDDVVIKAPDTEKSAIRLRPKLDVDLSADLGKNFLFDGAGLTSRLVGDVRLRANGRDLPRASGSIRTRDGRFEAYGQQLEIERGILTFQGLLENPALDVRAVRKGLAVEAGVQVSGSAQKPRVKLISDPELPDAEKLSWLVLGHGPEQMGAGDATLLLSAAGSILGRDSGGIVKQLKTTFGIDEFGVRQGGIGDTGSRPQSSRVAGSRVDTTASTGNQILSVGKRLSSNAMLSYEQTLGEAESIVKLTVNLTREISVIGRAGSDNAVDIFYTISFGKPERNAKSKKAP